MAGANIHMSDGEVREGKTRYHTYGAAPKSRTIEAYPGESLASITERAYGTNTSVNRQKIRKANGTLDGSINVPH